MQLLAFSLWIAHLLQVVAIQVKQESIDLKNIQNVTTI